ncbi:MAG: hypothetical protein K6L74_02975 [Neptuniibacter sp.]
MRVLITSLIFISLVGCVSAPYRDDYTAHIDNISEYYDEETINFVLVGEESPDIRGIYANDDTTVSSPVLYQGVGGLAGLIAQIGTHASIINSQRNSKLAEAQALADAEIEPLINAAKEIKLSGLMDTEISGSDENISAPTVVKIKPIFFASSSMDKISLNMIVWIDKKGSSEGDKPKYQNLIQVFSKRLSTEQSEILAKGDKQLFTEIMASLLNTSLQIAKADLTGKYANVSTPEKTHLVEKHYGEKVVRGSVVDQTCEYTVIRDIHSWFIAHSRVISIAQEKDTKDGCIATALAETTGI